MARRTDLRYQFVGRSDVLNNRVSSLSRLFEEDLVIFISLIPLQREACFDIEGRILFLWSQMKGL